MKRSSDVLIVGGGIIGLAIAREAALAGLSVRLFEPGEPGGEASGAAAGMLGAQLEAEHHDPFTDLGLASRKLYDEFIASIREESGVDPNHRTQGTLVVACSPDEEEMLERRFTFQREARLEVERLDRTAMLQHEPGIGRSFGGGLMLPHDTSIEPPLFMRGLRLAAVRAGVDIRCGAPVSRLLSKNRRVVGAEVAGEVWVSGTVVMAAGAWSGAIEGEAITPPPTSPVKGQIVCLEAEPATLRHLLWTTGLYLVPRGDGRIVIGSTSERIGFDRSVTAGALSSLIDRAVALIPAFSGAAFHSAWAGLRPAVPDGLPVIGPGAVACGHFRHGILLAPITARIVVRLLRGENPEFDLAPFDPRRFTSDA
jgi:glycine oxidase